MRKSFAETPPSQRIAESGTPLSFCIQSARSRAPKAMLSNTARTSSARPVLCVMPENSPRASGSQ